MSKNDVQYLQISLLTLLISLLHIPSLIQTQCNTELPDNSIAILDSNTHHTVSSGDTFPVAFDGWSRIEVDKMIYPVSAGGSSFDDTLGWGPPSLNTGQCGPIYISCFQTNLVPISTVDTDEEMNWLVSSYYETEANVVFIRIAMYRPISILCAAALVCERLVGSQLHDFHDLPL